MNDNSNIQPPSAKEIILRIKDWIYYLLKFWYFFLVIGIVGGLSGFFYAKSQHPTYVAKTTFILEEAKSASSSLGGLASLAGQFGVDVGGVTGGGILSGDNILLYFKSPSLAKEVLLSRYDTISNELIIDKYSKVYKFQDELKKNKKIGPVFFGADYNNKNPSRLHDSLINKIVEIILVKQFKVNKTDKKASFIDVLTSMEDENLAKVYCERIVQKVVERYINIKTQRQKASVQKLQERVDSIASLLSRKTI